MDVDYFYVTHTLYTSMEYRKLLTLHNVPLRRMEVTLYRPMQNILATRQATL